MTYFITEGIKCQEIVIFVLPGSEALPWEIEHMQVMKTLSHQ